LKILFITNELRFNSGGAVVDNRNLTLLQNTYGKDNVLIYEFGKKNKKNGKLYSKYVSLFGGISSEIVDDIKRIVKTEEIKVLFISNSIYGIISRKIRLKDKKVIIVTFLHNVEYLYLKDFIKFNKVLSKYILLFFVKMTEKMAVTNSDVIISLNKRDSDKLFSIYGRKADFLLPTSLEDNNHDNISENAFNDSSNNLELLFVGSNFYANIHGINWFVDNVMTKVKNVKLTVVGNGLNDKVVNSFDNVHIYGRVENLSEFYAKAHIVIMPIFLGSGMKTKTGEALMYGKPILATKEALEGYCIKEVNLMGAQCDSDIEFIERINYLNKNKAGLLEMGIYSRKLFLDKYSNDKSMDVFINTIKVKVEELLKIRYV
jgi:hypothetical protein